MSHRSALRFVFGTFAVVAVTLHFMCMHMINADHASTVVVTHVASDSLAH